MDHSIGLDRGSWQSDAIAWVQDQLGRQTIHWRIASVHQPAAESLRQAIAAQQPNTRADQAHWHDVPLKTRVDEPDRLGIDRLLSAYAASNRFTVPLIVIDAGSCVTVDYVSSESEFVGGAILPGLSMQARALAAGTDALPHIRLQAETALPVPGQNTVDAIRLGVLLGLAGSIERLVEDYQDLSPGSPQNCQVVVTGGDAATLSPRLRFTHEITPNLVCRGLLDLPRLDKSPTTGSAGLE
jgi:type III pantothenate kinase